MKKKVIIVGAGIAGMKASMELVKSGFQVEVFESKSQIGGRCYSMIDQTTGDVIDNGQHIFAGAYEDFFEMLQDLGSLDKIYPQSRFGMNYYDSEQKYTLAGGGLPAKLGLLQGFLSYNALDFSSKIGIIKLLVAANFINADKYTSAKDLLIRYKQSEQAIKYFWEPVILATMNQSVEKSSAKIFINVISKLFESSKSSKLYFSKVGLSQLFDNFENFISQVNSSKLHLGKKMSRIIFDDHKAKGIMTSDGESHIADYIILSVPPKSLNNIAKESEFDEMQVQNFDYSTIISYYVWLSEEICNAEISGLIGTKSHWLFNKRKISQTSNELFPYQYTVTISNADALSGLSHSEIEAIILNDLRDCKLLGSAKVLHSRLIVDKRATVSLDFANEKLRPSALSSIENVFIAGDWTATGLPATIEGAAQSGKKAAKILKSKEFSL